MTGLEKCSEDVRASTVHDCSLDPATPRRFAPTPRKLALLLFLVSLALYLPAVRYEFVWDDVYYVLQNPVIRTWRTWALDFVSPKAYGAAMITPPMFRPLRNISYRVDWMIAGPHPAWWHAHNILLHALNGVLLFALLRRVAPWLTSLLGKEPPSISPSTLAFLAALTWAVHPVHTESVAWVKSRDELLFALWSIICLLFIALGAAGLMRSLHAWVGGVCACGLALLSKEMAVSLPLILILWAWCARRDSFAWRFILSAAIAMGALVAIFVAWRHRVLGTTAMCDYLSGSFAHEMLTMVRAAARYVTLTLWPAHLVADYAHFEPTRSLAEGRWWLALSILVATIALAFVMRRREPLITVGILWFWIALLPVSNVIPTMQYLAERFLYFPLSGAALAFYGLLGLLSRAAQAEAPSRWPLARAVPLLRPPGAPALTFVAAFAVSLLVARTTLRLGVWRNERLLYAATLREAPRNGRALINVAIALSNTGRPDLAQRWLDHFMSSNDPVLRRVNPHMLLRARAAAAMGLGRYEEAIQLWREALSQVPNDTDALLAVAVGEGSRGNHEGALRYFLEAARLDPDIPGLRRNIIIALYNTGREAEARAVECGELAIKDIQTTPAR